MTPPEIAKKLGQYPTATIYEAAGKVGDMEPGIRPIVSGAHFSGIAYTVKTFPSDTTAVITTVMSASSLFVFALLFGFFGTKTARSPDASSNTQP